MKPSLRSLIVAGAVLAGACADDNDDNGPIGPVGMDASIDSSVPDGGSSNDAGLDASVDARLDAFVSSDKSTSANLGGLKTADTHCQTLAAAVGAGTRG